MKRERWDSRAVFILAAIGSAIGLGNIWRFPYIAYKNGGGAFLIPYFIALLTAGIPILILEMGLGQYFQAGAASAFRKARPWFEFVGWWAIMIATVITFYYCAIMAWSFNYLFYSFSLQWEHWQPVGAVLQAVDAGEKSLQEAFFMNHVLDISGGPDQIGHLSMGLLIGLILTWVWIYIAIRKGVRSVGKMVLVTVPLPFLLLIIIFFKAISLPGSIDGILAYLRPDFSALARAKVWAEAYGQIFFSLSVGFGVMCAYASFRPRKGDIVNSAMITGLSNSGTEFFAGFAVFGVLGFMAHELSVQSGTVVTPDSVVSSGIILAFVTFPKAIAMMGPWATIMGIMFFLMLLTLGVDSAFSLVEAASTAISDELQLNQHKVSIGLCVVGFLAGLLFITQGGLFWLDIVDNWMSLFGLIVIAFLEALFFGWFFDLKILTNHFDKYSELKAGKLWIAMVKYVAPLVLIIIISWNFLNEVSNPYEGYPMWALWLGGWGVTLLLFVHSWVLSVAQVGKRFPMGMKIAMVATWAVYFIVFWMLYPESKFHVLKPAAPWIMAAIGCIILYGGIARSLIIAHKHAKEKDMEDETPVPE
ncbi:MAG TPA: sodium-dependent transporter [Firmicutes bacterium]|nr:sodium-dependent transporter [Bacillota bacterium]